MQCNATEVKSKLEYWSSCPKIQIFTKGMLFKEIVIFNQSILTVIHKIISIITIKSELFK